MARPADISITLPCRATGMTRRSSVDLNSTFFAIDHHDCMQMRCVVSCRGTTATLKSPLLISFCLFAIVTLCFYHDFVGLHHVRKHDIILSVFCSFLDLSSCTITCFVTLNQASVACVALLAVVSTRLYRAPASHKLFAGGRSTIKSGRDYHRGCGFFWCF